MMATLSKNSKDLHLFKRVFFFFRVFKNTLDHRKEKKLKEELKEMKKGTNYNYYWKSTVILLIIEWWGFFFALPSTTAYPIYLCQNFSSPIQPIYNCFHRSKGQEEWQPKRRRKKKQANWKKLNGKNWNWKFQLW